VSEQNVFFQQGKKLEIKNEEMNNFYNGLYNFFMYSQDGIYVVDRNGYTVQVNPAFEEITGISAEEVIGCHMTELVSKGYFDRSVALDVQKTKSRISMVQLNRNGKVTLVTGNPVFNEKGEVIQVVSNIRDITMLIQMYQQSYERWLMNNNSEDGTMETKDVVVASSQSRKNISDLKALSAVDSTVLIYGESGVGKTLYANLIHKYSPRKDAPFVTVSCGAIPENLLESELFGYDPGAFTGANRIGKIGFLESAQGGTILLDDISDLPLSLQPKLLLFLDTGLLTRVGSVHRKRVDIRVITATNRDLKKMVEEGKFREDLYYRISVVPLHVLPLRERREDILPLARLFLHNINTRYDWKKTFSKQVMDRLVAYQWPGNVRELKNFVERIAVMSSGNVISLEDLPKDFSEKVNADKTGAVVDDLVRPTDLAFPMDLAHVIKKVELRIINEAIRNGGSIRAAARMLGVNPSTIVRKIKQKGCC
jgi:PAS domain S-box-containing protein